MPLYGGVCGGTRVATDLPGPEKFEEIAMQPYQLYSTRATQFRSRRVARRSHQRKLEAGSRESLVNSVQAIRGFGFFAVLGLSAYGEFALVAWILRAATS